MKRTGSRIRALLVLAAALGLVAVAVASGILPRLRARQALRQQTTEFAAPPVTTLHPKLESTTEEVILPGNMQAFIEAPLYARTSGYLKSWNYDIGAHVKKRATVSGD